MLVSGCAEIVVVFRDGDIGETMNSVEDLDVFKLAHQLALKTYSATKAFPREELFSLGDQTRRAAGSVGMNLSALAKPVRQSYHHGLLEFDVERPQYNRGMDSQF